MSEDLHVTQDGPPRGRPVLLVHGSGASGRSWSPVVPALAAGHRVIRVDLAGHGRSAPGPSYGVAAQAGRVAAVLDRLGLREVVVVGHSSGGYVGTALAESRPDLVAALALVSTGPGIDALLPRPLLLRALTAPPVGRLLWALRTDAMLRRAINETTARPVDLPGDVLADMRALDYRVFRTALRQTMAYVAAESMPQRLAGLGIPVLAVFGAADRRWAPASARRYATVPGARVEMLPEVGHVPMFEAPGALADLLLGFLDRRPGERDRS